MHTPAPLVVRVGGIVDTLGTRVGGAQGLIHRQPILQREHRQHADGIQMLLHNPAALLRGLVVPVPEADGGHVVRRSSHHAQVRPAAALLHTLHLQGQDLLVIHHAGHAVRNHAKVLPASQHPRTGKQLRELAHGIIRPEIIMPVIEEIGVEILETLLLPTLQARGIRGDERMEPARLARILDEQAEDGQAQRIYLRAAVRQGRIEMAQQAALMRKRNLPDTEEPQDMVDTVGVKYFAIVRRRAFHQA